MTSHLQSLYLAAITLLMQFSVRLLYYENNIW